MIAFLLLAAAASPGPIMHSAQAPSTAYRDCVAAAHKRRPATVAEIGRHACAAARSRLVERVRDHVSFGWAATARTDGQARRLRVYMKQEAESQVAGFETRLQDWLAGAEKGGVG
jgi:hypothetical protein